MSQLPSATRLRQISRWRAVSWHALTPSRLRQQLAAFETGNLREAASVWEWIEQRDDLVKAVVAKRRKSVARHGWEILPMPGEDAAAPAVRAQIETLRRFYSTLRCTHALDENERGVRVSTTSLRFFRNGVFVDGSGTATATSKPSLNIQLWAYNVNGSPGAPLPARGSFYSIGQALSDGETALLNTAVRNLQIALNRAVV